MRTFVMGDPHGALRAIKQVFERSKFDLEKDRLIVLGDVADGWPEVAQALDFLIDNVKNLIYVRGNHDQWLKDWLKEGKRPDIWTMQGGQNSLKSYLEHPDFPTIGKKHLEFLKKTPCYYKDEQNRVFVHGGVNFTVPVEKEKKIFLMWDRCLWDMRNQYSAHPLYAEVYVGHTDISRFSHLPLHNGNVWFMDTGAGWGGWLSMMDVDSKRVFQSDNVKDLYPESRGRNEVFDYLKILRKHI